MWSLDTSINIGECVVIINCQSDNSAILYKASLAALIDGGCKNASGSSISNILGLSSFIAVLPIFNLPESASDSIADHKNVLCNPAPCLDNG